MHQANPPSRRIPARVSLGTALNDVAAHGLLASYRAYRGGGKLDWHEHGEAYLCVVLDGGYAQTASQEIECIRGSLIAHPPGHAHANHFGPLATRCVNLCFDPSMIETGPLSQLLADYRHVRIDPRYSALTRLERELQTRDAGTSLAVAAAAFDLLGQVMRLDAPAAPPRWLPLVREAIIADVARTPSLSALATVAGVHPAHLARAYRAATGETVGGFARRVRLEAADRLLAGGCNTIAEVAAATGFYDQAHFARAYRRRFGMTPSARRLQSLS